METMFPGYFSVEHLYDNVRNLNDFVMLNVKLIANNIRKLYYKHNYDLFVMIIWYRMSILLIRGCFSVICYK